MVPFLHNLLQVPLFIQNTILQIVPYFVPNSFYYGRHVCLQVLVENVFNTLSIGFSYLGLLCSSGAGSANFAPVSCVTFSHCSLQVVFLFYCFLAASFRSHARKREFDSKTKVDLGKSNFKPNSGFDPLLPLEEKSPNSPNSTRSYGDTQIETFNHRHGLLMLHLLAVLMFVPSFVAWFQRIGVGQSFPWFLDSALCVGVILHGLCGSKPEYNFISFPFLHIQGQQVGLSIVYMLAGFYCYLSGFALAPYRAFYAMAAVGVISAVLRILEKSYRDKGEAYFSGGRKHFHRH